jgi:hypothetical protein
MAELSWGTERVIDNEPHGQPALKGSENAALCRLLIICEMTEFTKLT